MNNEPSPPMPVTGTGARIRRILLATDLSGASEAATAQALELAHGLGAELLIVSVIDPAARVAGGLRVLRLDQHRAAREAAARSLVVRGRSRAVSAYFLVWEGEPGPSIVAAAASEQADMVIVGSHGRGVVGRFVLGSVSEHVVRHAPCPVLVVRALPAGAPAHERGATPPVLSPVTSGPSLEGQRAPGRVHSAMCPAGLAPPLWTQQRKRTVQEKGRLR